MVAHTNFELSRRTANCRCAPPYFGLHSPCKVRNLPNVATCMSFHTSTHARTHMTGCAVRVRMGVKIEVHVHSNRHHLLARNGFGESIVVLRSVAILREKDDTGRPGPWARTACSFRSAQAATLLEFHVPFTNCLSVGGLCGT